MEKKVEVVLATVHSLLTQLGKLNNDEKKEILAALVDGLHGEPQLKAHLSACCSTRPSFERGVLQAGWSSLGALR